MMMTKRKSIKGILLLSAIILLLPACGLRGKTVNGKAHVEFKWRLHTDMQTGSGWLIANGWVINKGSKRADWVRVTVYSIDKKTGVVVDKTADYIKGSGPNGKSLEPGEVGTFEIRLDSKKAHHYKYDRAVTWSESY